jgi:hypothetical protein
MPAWLPSNMTSIQAWFDPTQGVTTVSGNVSSWADVMGSWTAVQGTSAFRPAFSSTSMNGFPGLTCVASATDTLQITSMPTTVPRSIISIVNVTSGHVNTLFGSLSAGGLQARNDSATNKLQLVKENVAGISLASSGTATGGYAIWVFTVDSGNYVFRLNGTGVGSGTHAITGISGGDALLYLSGPGGATEAFDGKSGDVIIVSAVSVQSELEQAEGYLAWKYSLSSLLPVGHPYKSAAPTIGGSTSPFIFPRSRHYVRR